MIYTRRHVFILAGGLFNSSSGDQCDSTAYTDTFMITGTSIYRTLLDAKTTWTLFKHLKEQDYPSPCLSRARLQGLLTPLLGRHRSRRRCPPLTEPSPARV
jgi:hypothetical protein